MATPYTSVTVTDYNLNPPSDDGAQTSANQITWSKHKVKLGDPLLTAVESINTNVVAAVGKLDGGVTAVTDDYTILATDQSNLVVLTSGSGKTITTPDATSVTAPFRVGVVNNTNNDLTLDGSGSQTIDGETTITLRAGEGVILDTDGSNWFTGGRFTGQVSAVPSTKVDNYTLALGDQDNVIRFDDGSGGALVCTIPTNASVAFPIKSYVTVVNTGTGDLTITGDTGVTVNGASAGSVTISTQYDGYSIIKVDTNEWLVPGGGAGA